MQLESLKQLKQAVDEADLVLVGLGEEWVCKEEEILSTIKAKDAVLYKIMQVVNKDEAYDQLRPVLYAYAYEKYMPHRYENAYRNLKDLLEGKNYFIVSLTLDSYLIQSGFSAERIVNPCGTYKKLQCENGCTADLISTEKMFKQIENLIILNVENEREVLDNLNGIIKQYTCPECDLQMTFNILSVNKYREEGYLEDWQRYMKWLQGTLNKKLCVIEAGVGMKLPSVIRWPFEKTVFYNQKSQMYRIHERFYQINEEVADRAYGCQNDAVSFFCD